jgi:putative ABC transport system ATP-binding protein
MPLKNLYRIGNLTCQYFDKKTKEFLKVLDVEDIHIFRGEITVILGPSGSGKSTFMEAISLMSQTIDPGSENVYFYPHGNPTAGINIAQLEMKEKELQELRFENYCFIFQDTNIMGNFNPVENVALPKMVFQPENAVQMGNQILRKDLNLRINLEKEANEYSGGQKQRFAFARAFMATGDLLFGDEPTGNLDKYNSEKLFGVIRQHISDEPSASPDSVSKIGAIIVTHSIDLALQFADRIIVIVKPERIDDENIIGERKDIRGYTNPFLVYRNSGKNAWRIDTPIDSDFEDGGILPPIDDDGSTRFVYKTETIEDERKAETNKTEDRKPKVTFVKDRLKKEIIFFLNNSYAAPQEILIRAAKELNTRLRPVKDIHDAETKAQKENLFKNFDELKKKVIGIVDEKANEKMKMTEFENKEFLLNTVRKEFAGNDEILQLIAEKKDEKSELNPTN